jgi:AcrR family transcriptional regulator
MSSPASDPQPSSSQTSRSSQRELALQAIVELTASDGYTHTTVAQITERAGLSRTSFYEHFADREHCFLAAQLELAGPLRAAIEQAVNEGEPAQALAGALSGLVAFAAREPLAFHLLTHEAMIAGPRTLDARDELMQGIEHTIQTVLECAPVEEERADIPVKLVLGGAVRLIGMSMRRTGGAPEPELVGLPGWLDCYKVPAQAARWQGLTPVESAPLAAATPTRPIPHLPLPKGSQQLSEEALGAMHRERLMLATAEVVCAKGYATSTVADIAAVANTSREVFYAHFADKQDAFLKAQQLVFEQMIAASAGAFFTAATPWAERIWEAIRTTTAWILDQPTLAHFDFIEAYALGPTDAQRVDENILAFNLFLEEGYRYRREAEHVPRLVTEAIAGSVVELAAHYIRHDRAHETPGLLPLLTYAILAPFTGPEAANVLIDGFIAAHLSPARG